MKTQKIALLAGIIGGLAISGPAGAGAVLKIDDEASLNLGFRIQALTILSDLDIDGDGSFDDDTNFRIRRGRFRLAAKVNKNVSAFIQTESADGGSMNFIDAWINLKYNNWAQLFVGEHMAPSSRQATTSSGALMAIGRPGNNTKNLTWGARALSRFSTATVGETNDPMISGKNAVRDDGMTFFGTGSFDDKTHLKYYAGIYDGVNNASTDDDSLRFTTRAQLNLFDAEPGYFNSSTYLGKKKTVGFGVSYDTQSDVQDKMGGGTADYSYWSIDAFTDWPVGEGYLTAEAAFSNLDLDDASASAIQSQGDGWYFQAGYYINQWQPWIEFESWDGDAATSNAGDYDSYRFGISYFLKGHNANVKLGFEKFDSDVVFGGTNNEDSIDTIVLGFYTTY